MATTITVTERSAPQNFAARISESLRSYVIGPLTSSDPAIASFFGGGAKSLAGPIVNEITMMTCSAVYASVRAIATDVAKLPLNLLKMREDGGVEHFEESKTYELLRYAANPETTAFEFRRTLMVHALTAKGGFAEIVRDGAGRPKALWMIHPNRIDAFYDHNHISADGRRNPLRYRVDGSKIFEANDILHIKNISQDGVNGIEILHVAREAIGLALASQQFAAAFFGNGTRFGGVLSSDQDLDDDQKAEIRKTIEDLHAKADKAFRLLVLGAGFKFDESGVKPNEAQMKEIRDQQVEEVSRYFRIPLHKINSLLRATNNNIEHQDLEYYKGCISDWTTTWEQELKLKLIPNLERRHQKFWHNMEAALRGDTAARTAFYTALLDRGVISADQVLSREDLNPQPNGQGKLLLVQGAMIPKDQLVELTDAKIEETKTKAIPPEPPVTPKTNQEVADAEKRARRAEMLAEEARAEAQATREQLIAIEARGTPADAAVIEQLRTAERESFARAAQFEIVAVELRQQHAAEVAAKEALAAELATVTAARADADLKLIQALRDVDARALLADLAVQEREASHAQLALALAAEQTAQAEAARCLALVETATATSEVDTQARVEAERHAREATAAVEQAREELARLTAEAASAAEREVTARAEAEQARAAMQTAAEALTAQFAVVKQQEAVRQDELAAQAETEARAQAERDALARERDAAQAALATVEAKAAATAAKIADLEAALAGTTDALRDVERADDAGVAAVIAAHRGMVVDIMRRMVERETDRARRAQTTPEKLRAWLERFYEGHEDLCRTALLPAIRVHLAFLRSTEDPIEATRRLVAAHVDDSKRQILTVLEGDADELAASLPALLHRWETERVATIADRLMEKELDYARRR